MNAKVMVNWNTVAGATVYKIYRDTQLVGSSTVTMYVDTGLSNGTTYNYRVVATNGAGDSTQSNAVAGKPLAVLPRPSVSSTGVPACTTLTASGDLTITTAGAVIDALDINGCVEVRAQNVTIRRTRIRCTDYYPLQIVNNGNLLIEDTEIASSGGYATSGIAFSDYVARRLNVSGSADGFKADRDATIEDSWVHDLWLGAGDHADGIQTTGGDNVTIRGNFIDILDRGAGHGGEPNSGIQGGTEWATHSNWLVENNWFYGGGWVINFDGVGGTNNRIINNRFGRSKTPPVFPDYGPLSYYGPVVVTGNVWDDDGSSAQ